MPHVRRHVRIEHVVTIRIVANDVVVGVALHLFETAVIVIADRQSDAWAAVNDLVGRCSRRIDRLIVKVKRCEEFGDDLHDELFAEFTRAV